jgi:oligopeptide transport system permease protein
MTEKYHLNDNIFVQYFKYMSALLQGDLGETFNGERVGQLIALRFPVSVRLAFVAVAIQAIIGITAGIMTGLRGRGYLDNLVLAATLFLISIPTFVTGFLLQVLLIKGEWSLFPSTVDSGAPWIQLLIPGFVLGSVSMAFVARLTRTAIMENKRADYVRTALAKGQPKSRIVGVHLLRNSALPVLTYVGTNLGALMGGAIVTEGIFDIKGIGQLVYQSILNKEGFIVTGVVVLLVIVFLLVNLIIDLLYAVIDPRIRYD